MPADAGVLSIEFKINLLAPASGDDFVARAKVLRPGRTVTVCQGSVFAIQKDSGETRVASMQASIMAVHNRKAVSG
jgi:acyl-coenzyme A thioesterase PaaI-like protein